MAQWFRKYADILENRKVQSLSGELYKQWDNLLALACRNDGKLPSDEDVAFALRIRQEKVRPLLKVMVSRGLFDEEDGELVPHNWKRRQYQGDCSTERVKRFRERGMKRDETVSETPPETDSETEQITANAVRPTRSRRGTTIPQDWSPNEQDIAHAVSRQFDSQRISDVAEHFRDHHTAKGTISKDWSASWRTWVANEIKFAGRTGNGNSGRNAMGNRQGAGSVLDALRQNLNAGDLGQQNDGPRMGRGTEPHRMGEADDGPGYTVIDGDC